MSEYGVYYMRDAKPTGQRPVGIPEENGTTFSDQTGPTKRNGSYHILSLFRIPYRGEKNGTADFGRNNPTEISGSPPEVIPNIPVGRNRNGSFHLTSTEILGFGSCERGKLLVIFN